MAGLWKAKESGAMIAAHAIPSLKQPFTTGVATCNATGASVMLAWKVLDWKDCQSPVWHHQAQPPVWHHQAQLCQLWHHFWRQRLWISSKQRLSQWRQQSPSSRRRSSNWRRGLMCKASRWHSGWKRWNLVAFNHHLASRCIQLLPAATIAGRWRMSTMMVICAEH